MQAVFFGSEDFAYAGLKALLGSRHRIVGCVTQPDKVKGRHLRMDFSDIKKEMLGQKIPLFQPEDLKDDDFFHALKDLNADIFIVISYGRFLPMRIRELPKTLSINVHASLLPKYRGAAPINWAIINGDKKTGVSIMEVSERMDAGDILAQEEMRIEDKDTAQSLRKKLADQGAKLLLKVMDAIEKDQYQLTKQSEGKATYAPKLAKKDGLIDWQCEAVFIHNMVRGFCPWPSAYAFFSGKILKFLDTEVVDFEAQDEKPATIIDIERNGFSIATGRGVLLVKRVHLESAKPMAAKSFIAGHRIKKGQRLE